LKPERKFWLELKEKTPNIIWNRIENLALPGIPDLLGYNKNHLFFTVELKVVKSRKVVKPLASRDWKLYEGKDILELDARGLLLEARCSGLEACCSLLEELGA
jgi:hypothetical protein